MKDKSGLLQIVIFRAFVMILFAALAILFGGCANRGCKVTVSSASVTSLGDINWDEYKIPVFAIYTGPRLVVWVNKDYLALSKTKCCGSVTNDTSALGIYTDHSGKTASVEMDFSPVTNLVTQAESIAE